MNKLEAFVEEFDPIDSINELRSTTDVNWACAVLGQQLQLANFELLSVKFCDLLDEQPAIRPYGAYPRAISRLALELRDTGGCPISKEAQKRLSPFDAKSIQRAQHSDLLSSRFLQELDKLSHAHIAVIPIVLGRGLAVYTIGLHENRFEGQLRETLVGLICNTTTALIGQFPDIAKLFESKKLTSIEGSATSLCSNGCSDVEIGKILGLSEHTIRIVLDTAARRLSAKNRSHLVSRALALGEISNVQCTLPDSR